jgi:hypothetical protein
MKLSSKTNADEHILIPGNVNPFISHQDHDLLIIIFGCYPITGKDCGFKYEAVSVIFGTAAAICTAVVVVRCNGR